MSPTGSVTRWIAALKSGDHAAAQKLWEGYFQRMVALARKKLKNARRRGADEEDVAVSAFASFCRGAAQGRFPQLRDRHNLWGLLLVITKRKAFDLLERERRKKRGGGAVRGESALIALSKSGSAPRGMEQILGREPSPDVVADVTEQVRWLLGKLTDPQLRSIAVWKMEGYTSREIAAKLGCVTGTVERKLRLIRSTWGKEKIE